MKAKRPRKWFNLHIKDEINNTIVQLSGVFNNYLSELQTVSKQIPSSSERQKQR